MHRLVFRPWLAAVTCSLLTAIAVPAAAAPAPLSATFQEAKPVTATWDPLREGLAAQAPVSREATSAGVRSPRAASLDPNFGGFRVAPSTPAHAAGDISRDLSSAEADFDHDGCKDIVTFQVANLTVMRGDCKGGFTKLQSQAAAFNVFHPVAVDLNHDGYPDLVAMTVPFGYAGTVVAMLNQQNGTFGAATVISRKASLYSGLMAMNVYDINGDGNADVIIAGLGTQDTMTNSNGVFEVIFGNADGSFGTQTLVETDGVLPYKPGYAYDGGSVLRKLGDQLYFYGLMVQSQRVDGTLFGSELLYRWAVSPTGVVDVDHPQITALPVLSSSPNKYIQFADLDGDGLDDFTLLNGDGMLYTAIGTQDGDFGALQAGLPVTAGNNAAVLAFRDVDGDGKVDAIMAGTVFLGTWPGNGDGTFRAPKITHHGGYAANASSGLTFPVTNHVIDDFDGDGVADIAFFDTIKRALCFYKGKADGTFVGAPALVSTTGEFQSNSLAVRATADLNGDGYRDIVVSSPYGLLGGISNGAGDFAYKILSPLQSIVSISAQAADFNRDGKDDVAFLSTDETGHVHLYIGLSNGDGTVTAVAQPLPFTSFNAPGLAIGDINGDGAPDLLLALNDYVTPSYGIWPMVNDGKGGFAAAPYIDQGVMLFAIAASDVNGDGQADLFVSYGSYAATTTAVYLATGSGGFATTASAVLQSTLVAGSILAQDVTGDGVVDAVVSVMSGASEGLMLYTGHPDGTFDAGTPLVTGVVPSYVGAADLNGDAMTDLYFTTTENVLTDAADSLMGLVVLRGAGNASFAPPVHYAIYGAAAPVLPIDLFQDGSPSLLAGTGSGTVVLLNNGGSTVSLTASAASVGSADPVTVTVRVTPRFSDQSPPTGTVDLRVDGAVVNRGSLRSNATASFTVSALAVGTHALSATYEGDASYNVNLGSNTVPLVVGKATPAFQLTSDTAQLALSAGGSTSSAISLSANNAFSGPVTLSCDGAPAGATCAFSQTSVTLAPGQTVTSMLTLTADKLSSRTRSVMLGSSGAGLAACCLLLLAPLLRRRTGSARRMLAVLMYLGTVGGCSSDPATPESPRGGAYAITVTATPSDPAVPAQTLTMVVVPAS